MNSLTTEEAVKKIILDAVEELTKKGSTRQAIKLCIQRQEEEDSDIPDVIIGKALENLASTGAIQANGDRFYPPEAKRLGAPSNCPACQKKRKRCRSPRARPRSCSPKCRKPCPDPCPSKASGGSEKNSGEVKGVIVGLVRRGGVRGYTETEIKERLQKEGANVSDDKLHDTLNSLVEQKKLEYRCSRYMRNPGDAEEEPSRQKQESPTCQKKKACGRKESCTRKPRCKRKKICSRSKCEKPKRGCKEGCPKCNEGQSQCESDSGIESDSGCETD